SWRSHASKDFLLGEADHFILGVIRNLRALTCTVSYARCNNNSDHGPQWHCVDAHLHCLLLVVGILTRAPSKECGRRLLTKLGLAQFTARPFWRLANDWRLAFNIFDNLLPYTAGPTRPPHTHHNAPLNTQHVHSKAAGEATRKPGGSAVAPQRHAVPRFIVGAVEPGNVHQKQSPVRRRDHTPAHRPLVQNGLMQIFSRRIREMLFFTVRGQRSGALAMRRSVSIPIIAIALLSLIASAMPASARIICKKDECKYCTPGRVGE